MTWEISRNHVLIVPAQITSMCDSLPFEYGWNHKSTFGWNEIPTLARQDETVAGIPEDEIRTPLKEGSVQLSWAHFCPNCAETCWICVRVLMEEIYSGALAGQQLAELYFSWWCQSLSLILRIELNSGTETKRWEKTRSDSSWQLNRTLTLSVGSTSNLKA